MQERVDKIERISTQNEYQKCDQLWSRVLNKNGKRHTDNEVHPYDNASNDMW